MLQEIAALEGGPTPLQSAGRFTITREGSPGGGLRLERGNKGKGKHNSPVKEKWKAEWKKAASRSSYVPSASLMGGEEFMDPYGGVDVARHPAGVKGFRSRKVGPAQATPASKLLAILGAEPDAGPQGGRGSVLGSFSGRAELEVGLQVDNEGVACAVR